MRDRYLSSHIVRDIKEKMVFVSGPRQVGKPTLHKYKNWKNYIKGIFDKHKNDFYILLTGSARLDIYRKGGDSLAGRYHQYILHPFSLAELLELKINNKLFDKLFFSENING